jgi:ankyrin repeat protein
MLIVDGVDQSDDTLDKFIESISEIVSQGARASVKIMLLGRYDSHTSDLSGRFENSVYIDLDDEAQHELSIRRFVEYQVAEFCRRRSCESMSDTILKNLLVNAQGMYLLPIMALNSLAKIHATPSIILAELNRFPNSLLTAYRQALDSVPLKSQPVVGSLLLWVVFSLRPLTVRELSSLVALDKHIKSARDLQMNTSVDLLGEEGVSRLLGPLLKVARKGDDAFVIFMHNSAREYLLRTYLTKEDDDNLLPPPWLLKMFYGTSAVGKTDQTLQTLASNTLTRLCIRYFGIISDTSTFREALENMRTTGGGIIDIQEIFRLDDKRLSHLTASRYVIEYLPEHVRSAATEQREFVRLLVSPSGRLYISAFWSLKDPGQAYYAQPPLHFACALGLRDIVISLLLRGHHPLTIDGSHHTALDVAVATGVVETLDLLCRLGRVDARAVLRRPNPRSSRYKYYNLLHVAAWYGYKDMVTYLLDLGLSPMFLDDLRRTPIDIAISAGSKELAELMSKNLPLADLVDHTIWRDKVDTLKWLIEDHAIQDVSFSPSDDMQSLVQEAIHRDSQECVAYLASRMTVQQMSSPHGCEIYFYVSKEGYNSILKKIIARDGFNINIKNQTGRTALHEACLKCQPDTIWTLILSGIDTSIVDNEGKTALDCLFRCPTMIYYIQLEPLERALAAFDNPQHRIQPPGRKGNIYHALLRGHLASTISTTGTWYTEIIQKLLEKIRSWGEDPTMLDVDEDGNTIHHLAATISDEAYLAAVKIAEPTVHLNNNGQTVLHILLSRFDKPSDSLYDRRELIVSGLVTKLETLTEMKDHMGRTPLHLAALIDASLFSIVLEHTRSMNDQDNDGRTPLMVRLFSKGLIKLMELEYILNKGYQLQLTDAEGKPTLWYALGLEDALYNRIFEAGGDISSVQDRHGRNILHEYLSTPLGGYTLSVPRLRHLLSRGADVRHRDNEGKLPIDNYAEAVFIAPLGTQDDVICTLVSRGADLNHYSNEKKSILLAKTLIYNQFHDADTVFQSLGSVSTFTPDAALRDLSARNAKRVLEYLMSKRQPDHDYAHIPFQIVWNLALIDASSAGDLVRVSYLVETEGADINTKDPWDRTALSLAAERARSDVVLYLVDKGADINIEDKFGRTALYWAARGNNGNIAKLLIFRGATITRYAAALLKLPHPELRDDGIYTVDIPLFFSTMRWESMRWESMRWESMRVPVLVAVLALALYILLLPSH